ncbi:MAG: DUF721 domain-containing protein [Rickettsiales bacterium]|jgi:hypothetical protein|nr:DUF721 domain-containing protein [Rickettsiales bacterium]
MTTSSSSGGRFVSLASSARRLLGHLGDDPRYQIIHGLVTNWKAIVGEKYERYCAFEKISGERSTSQGTVYLISYNSSASFFLSSNSQYLVDRMNSIFGRRVVTRVLVREIPTVIDPIAEKNDPGKTRSQRNPGLPSGSGMGDNSLKNSLEELGECFRSS